MLAKPFTPGVPFPPRRDPMKKVFALLRKDKKRQVELARFLGVKKSAVTNWKRGGNISPVHAQGIVRFFGGRVTLQDIYPMKNGRGKCA